MGTSLCTTVVYLFSDISPDCCLHCEKSHVFHGSTERPSPAWLSRVMSFSSSPSAPFQGHCSISVQHGYDASPEAALRRHGGVLCLLMPLLVRSVAHLLW